MFGSYYGIYIFDPSKIIYDTYTPPVIFTGLWINGVGVRPGGAGSPLSKSITTTPCIKLNYHQNSFNLEYAMLNFHAPQFNQYIYYLEGYEKDWNVVSRYNIAAYRNVPPGSYTFRVKGCNSFGVWNESETVLEIVISPPFWKSGLAVFFYVVALLLTGFFALRLALKFNRLNMAVEVEKQLTDYKLRFFTNISHEFRTPLTIIRGSIENLAGRENLPASVAKQINILAKGSANLLRLIDQLLEFRLLQNNKLELKVERTEVVSFFHDIYLLFKELSEKRNIRFLFDADVPHREMLIDKGKMDKIIYNLLSNAFKHTPSNGQIVFKLVCSEANDKLTLSVTDSGIGIPKEKQGLLFVRFQQINYSDSGRGIGLHLAAELASDRKSVV
jgi:signal transduction histidine kinase